MSNIKIAFSVSASDDDITKERIYKFAKLNKEILLNESIIIHNQSMEKSLEIDPQFREFSIIPVQCTSNLDDIINSIRAKIFVRFCSESDDMIPTIIPSYIHCSKNVTPFGDIFHSMQDFPLSPFPEATDFDRKCIQPALKIVSTVAYSYKNITGIFFGTKQPLKIPVYDIKEIPKPISLPPKPTSPMQLLRDTIFDIKKNNINLTPRPTRIKLLCNWADSSQLHKDWNKMSKNGKWNWPINIELVKDGEEADYYIIINKPPPGEVIHPNKTIVFRMEPYIDDIPSYNDWLNISSPLVNSDKPRKEDFLYFLDNVNFRNNTEYWLSNTVEQLNNKYAEKSISDRISTVVSSQYTMVGHRLRIDFIKYFQTHSKVSMDVFGYDNKFNFSNHKGELPIREKNNGILPYKYHFAVENSNIPNYFTEKFNDAIIGECLLFYWGCENISEHINPKAFIRLNLDYTEESMELCTKLIEQSIADDEWSKRINIIRQEKSKLLNQFNFFPRISSLIYTSKISFNQLIIPGDLKYTIPGVNIQCVPIIQNIPMDYTHKALRYYMHPTIPLMHLRRLIDHSNLWKTCSSLNQIICILESCPKTNFLDHLTTILAVEEREWDIIFLSWEQTNSSELELSNRTLLTPLWNHIVKHVNTSNDNGTQSVKVSELGKISSGYIIHPRMANKLVEIVDKYGFFTNLDEFFFLLHRIIPNIKTFIPWKNLVNNLIPIESEYFHIFHKLSDGKYSNALRSFSYPPNEDRADIILMPDANLRKQISGVSPPGPL